MNKLKFLPDLSGSAAIRMDLLWEVNHGFCYNGPLDSHILLGFLFGVITVTVDKTREWKRNIRKTAKLGRKLTEGEGFLYGVALIQPGSGAGVMVELFINVEPVHCDDRRGARLDEPASEWTRNCSWCCDDLLSRLVGKKGKRSSGW